MDDSSAEFSEKAGGPPPPVHPAALTPARVSSPTLGVLEPGEVPTPPPLPSGHPEKSAPASTSSAPPAQPPPPPQPPAATGQVGGVKKSFGLSAARRNAIKDFFRIYSFSTWADKLIVIVAALGSLGAGVTMPMTTIVFGRMVGSFTTFYKYDAATSAQLFKQSIEQCALSLTYLFVARLGLEFIAYFGFRMASLRISAALRLEYLKALLHQPISTLDALPPGQTAAIITVTASVLQLGISEKLSQLLECFSLIVSALVISFGYSWKLVLVTSTGLIFIVIVYAMTASYFIKLLDEVQEADMTASAIANEIFNSVRMISACGAELKMEEKYAKWVHEGRRRGLKMPPLIALQQAPVFFAVYAIFSLSFWYSFKLYLGYEIKSPEAIIVYISLSPLALFRTTLTVTSVLMCVMLMTTSISSVTGPLSAATRAAGAATIFYSVIDAPRPNQGHLKPPHATAVDDIVMEHINFAYPARPTDRILNDLSVRFPAGKVTAIVGPSGSGKSTIVGLLERWYELDDGPMGGASFLRNGTITTAGRHLKDIDLKWWRAQIGLVQQEPFLFNDTIYNNVEFGLIGTRWENESLETKQQLVKQACEEAFADDFISQLPEGYATTVGDAGIKLSGGQRQRLAIARSIVRKPKILILDEATSSIDVRSELMVQAALERASQHRTTITIAHRLSTIKKADNIVVLRKGCVVQQGTHESLMTEVGGTYWILATAQQLAMAPGAESKPKLSLTADYSNSRSLEFIETEESISGDTITDHSQTILEKRAKPVRSVAGSFGLLLSEQARRWKWYLALLLGTVGGGVCAPLQAYLFAQLLTLYQFWGDFVQKRADFWCLMFFLLAIVVGLSYFAMGWSATTLALNLTREYRREYFHNIQSKSIAFFDADENSVGTLTARLATDPAELQQLLGMNMAFVVISIFSIVGSLVIAFYFGWKLTIVSVSSSMPLVVAAAIFRIRYETQFEQMNTEVFEHSAKFATEAIDASRTVAALTLEDTISSRYETLLKTHIRRALYKSGLSTFLFALSDSISFVCMAFVLWYGGKLMLDREYVPFQYIVVYIAIMQGGMSAGQWLSHGPSEWRPFSLIPFILTKPLLRYKPNKSNEDIAKATVAANRIIDMREGDHVDGKLISLDFGNIGDNDKGVKIQLENIWFRYPTRDVPILNGLNMNIEKGQFAAIVGPSGCGKTTIISLLERFYAPKSGRILYNGSDISYLSVSHYRQEISLVAQEPNLFNGSIRENILLGVDENLATDEEVQQACQDAGIHDFISSLPDGYNTPVGSKGIALSGGQKQRLSIARALVRNPRLLLLDEATSNLDAETEKAVQAVFERNKKNRTMVVVAHRLATIQNADVIFVLADGRVKEKGDHTSLLRQKGLYYQMCQSQALDR